MFNVSILHDHNLIILFFKNKFLKNEYKIENILLHIFTTGIPYFDNCWIISTNGTDCCRWNATNTTISTNISGALPGFCTAYVKFAPRYESSLLKHVFISTVKLSPTFRTISLHSSSEPKHLLRYMHQATPKPIVFYNLALFIFDIIPPYIILTINPLHQKCTQ